MDSNGIAFISSFMNIQNDENVTMVSQTNTHKPDAFISLQHKES
jgi:hypothetical protein